MNNTNINIDHHQRSGNEKKIIFQHTPDGLSLIHLNKDKNKFLSECGGQGNCTMFMVRKVIAATLEHKLLASHYLKTKEPCNAAILLPGAYSTELKPYLREIFAFPL